MDTLKEGAAGPDIARLQQLLKQKGFPPGALDGNFGPGTEAALLAFQRSEGLVADGVVGPKTAEALGFAAANLPAASPMPAVTVAIVSKMFTDAPLDHIKTHLPNVLTALIDKNLTGLPLVLAALGTIRAETAGFVPINEGISRFNTSPGGEPFDLYDHRKDLGNQGPHDGANFKGRGFVQLTGRSNYTKFGPLIGLPNLVDQPDQANAPAIAAKLLAAFLDAVRTALTTALNENDLARARRLVNGGAHGLDQFSSAYQIGMKLLGPA